MIRHYDMASGQTIDEPGYTGVSSHHSGWEVETRLVSVTEAALREPRQVDLPPDLLTADVSRFLRGQD